MQEETDLSIKLYYWRIRGAAQPIRHLCEYLHIPYKQIACDCPKKWFGKQVQQLKKKCAFATLPYIEDQGLIVTQIVPIMKYLCKKACRRDLLGRTLQDEVKIQQLLHKFIRNRNRMFDLWQAGNDPNQAMLKEKSEKIIPELMNDKYFIPVLRMIEKKDWLFGYLTIADFFVYETCFYFSGFWPQKVSMLKYFMALKKRFEEIKEIKEYNESQRATLKIFLNPILNYYWKGDSKFL